MRKKSAIFSKKIFQKNVDTITLNLKTNIFKKRFAKKTKKNCLFFYSILYIFFALYF